MSDEFASRVATEFPNTYTHYPWDRWEDGQIHEVALPESARPDRFARAAHRHAEERNWACRTAVRGNTVWLQFLPKARRGLRSTRVRIKPLRSVG